MDFSTFLISMATSAHIHMGLIPVPGSEKIEKNLETAKQTIDILEILKQKTEGNRTEEETRLFEDILYNLRMNFVESSKTK